MATNGLTAAERLNMQEAHHEAHHVEVEDVPDEADFIHPEPPHSASILESRNDETPGASWNPSMSSNGTGKQAASSVAASIDTQDPDLFPILGGGKGKSAGPAAAPKWNATGFAGPNNDSTPNSSGVATPTSSQPTPRLPVISNIPGRATEQVKLLPADLMPRTQLKKPLPDIVKDVNKRSKANVTVSNGAGGALFLNATGPSTACREALSTIVAQIAAKHTITMKIPKAVRGRIVGKGGATIKALQDRTGARIQMPKNDDVNNDDDEVEITIEGNTLSAGQACQEISLLANAHAPRAESKVRVPAEFYPFLAGPNHQNVRAYEAAHEGVSVHIPEYHQWTAQRPPQHSNRGPATFLAPTPDNLIQLSGDRQRIELIKRDLERRAQELSQQLAVEQMQLSTGLHEFIVGPGGMPHHEFLTETGCHIIFPSDPNDELITVIGPVDRIQSGVDRAYDLAGSMNNTAFDIQKYTGGAAHARNFTRYMRERKELERLKKAYNTSIKTNQEGPWDLVYRDNRDNLRAQTEIRNIAAGHPPSRMATIPIDDFYHAHLHKTVAPQLQEKHGVLLIIPEKGSQANEVLLVFEGPQGLQEDFQVPRSVPSATEIQAFKQGIEDARQHILDLISAQEELKVVSEDVPAEFHGKLKKFIFNAQQLRQADNIPIRVSATGTTVTLRGPSSAVDELLAKLQAFVQQEIEDEKERGHTMTFDFPPKHANKLVGAGGSHIKELREKFDVDIQIENGVVTLKGPPKKAEAAKAHISSIGRQWADETTHVLKVDSKFHGNLIGKSGENLSKLQNKYKGVRIDFPRAQGSTNAADDISDSGAPVKVRRQQAADEVIVRGPSRAADATRDELLDLLQHYKDTSFSETVVVPQKHVGMLMGSGGKGIEEIRSLSQAKVEIPNSRDASQAGDMVEIQISGTKQQVSNAKKMIMERKSVLDRTVTQTMEVEREHRGALIGQGGSNLMRLILSVGGPEDRHLQNRMVQLPKTAAEGNTISVTGDQEIVAKLVAAMTDFVAERQSQITETVDVPISKHRTLIGQGGRSKNELQEKFTVTINVPRQGDGQTGVKITGKPDNVSQAVAYIQDITKEAEGETVLVPRAVHHAVSDNGQFFRRLKGKSVAIDHAGQSIPAKPVQSTSQKSNGAALPLITDEPTESSADAHAWHIASSSASSGETGTIPWVFRGPPEAVAAAKAQLAAAIAEAQLQTAIGYLTLEDPSLHRYIIGSKGRKIESIRADTGCRITVPREGPGAIEVVGSEEGVLRAREMMLDAVRSGGDRGA